MTAARRTRATPPAADEPSRAESGRWVMTIPGWRPAFDNEIMAGHRMKAHRLKTKDVKQIATAALTFGVPQATGKRRVGLTIRNRFGPFPDDTAPYKSLLDALVRNGLLVDDSREWCELKMPPTYERGAKETTIELEDV